MTDVAENAWRGELTLKQGQSSILLRCTMDVLARLLSSLQCETLLDVTRKWDGLSPEVLKTTLKVFAVNPPDADAFWPCVTGLAGLEIQHAAFHRLISGMNPDEIREDEEARKKLEIHLAARSTLEIAAIVKALNLG